MRFLLIPVLALAMFGQDDAVAKDKKEEAKQTIPPALVTRYFKARAEAAEAKTLLDLKMADFQATIAEMQKTCAVVLDQNGFPACPEPAAKTDKK